MGSSELTKQLEELNETVYNIGKGTLMNKEYHYKAVLVQQDYAAECNDGYIGVNSKTPVTITLPNNCKDCHQIIIKAEMDPPLANRKITIVSKNGNIDGFNNYVIQTSWDSVTLLHRNNNWFIIR